ncbi:MAG: LytTR family DNA-binding domain-containing protein [Fibromonadales bacterium]|nr:LytTR family DNA-binding domain-containing protein [Fibromonadales bacterium]
MKILIIDDEPLARVRMRKLLLESGKELEIDEADGADQALAKIIENKPFAVFLDIQMPGKGGFELVEDLVKIPKEDVPHIIFATAFDEYAIKAFEKNAIDYLLKPIEQDRLLQTLEKLIALENTNKGAINRDSADIFEKLKTMIESKNEKYLHRLQVKIGDRTLLINISDIVRFESDEKYTAVYTSDSRYIIDTPIIDLENKLAPEAFIKVHRAHLVAVGRIAEIRRQFPGKLAVILNDNAKTVIPVGRNYVDKVRDL